MNDQAEASLSTLSVREAFNGKVVWISGASSGIGEGMCRAFANNGARLVLSGRNVDELGRVHDDCVANGATENNLMVLPLDVLDYESMPAAAEAVVAQFGSIDLLINNAGQGARAFCEETSMDVYEQIIGVNLLGSIALTKAVLPVMIEQGYGRIAGTSSPAGKAGVPWRSAYCAAKHGVCGFFDSLRAEVAYHGIKVSLIIPGLVRTNTVANALHGNGEVIGAENGVMDHGLDIHEAAEIILTELAAGTDEFLVGDGPELQIIEAKRKDPEMVFRFLEKEAEGMR